MICIGVLVPHFNGPPQPPERRPIGRAALQLAHEGIDVIFGSRAEDGRLIGHRAVPNGWESLQTSVVAALDRYPSQTDPNGYTALLRGLNTTPISNPPALNILCRDKVATQRFLTEQGVVMPPIEVDPTAFESVLTDWGSAFLKPQFGSLGRGIHKVTPGDPLPAEGEGAVPGRTEPLFLQRAITPPRGFAGVACRILVQRQLDDTWWVGPIVVRRHLNDPVVNAARGAEVCTENSLPQQTPEAIQALVRHTAEALTHAPNGEHLVEVGLDAVIDEQGHPHLIEVNARPRGRLEALATQDPGTWMNAHIEACARPLRWLSRLG